MRVFKHLFNFAGGLTIGTLITWNMDPIQFSLLKELFTKDAFIQQDYLHITKDLPIPTRRQIFLHLLQHHGPSYRLTNLLSEFSRIGFQQKVKNNSDYLQRSEQLSILQDLFRSYYPQLFSQESGKAFIASLPLHLYCKDDYSIISISK